MAEICVKAVITVADLERKDVNLELIKVSDLKLLDGFTNLLSAWPCTCIVKPRKPEVHCVAACTIMHGHVILVHDIRLMQCVNGL